MKGYITYTKKHISILLILTMIFSMFSGLIVVNAAPAVLSIKYERERENTSFGPVEKNRLIIYGSGFANPKVKAGQVSELPIPINSGLSNSDVIVIDDQAALKSMEGIINKITILNNGTDPITGTNGILLNLTSIPTVTNVSTSKVYIGQPLEIQGLFFDGLSTPNDELYVAGTKYALSELDPDKLGFPDNKIPISNVKSPIDTGLSSIKITRVLNAENPQLQITSTLKNSITVVDKLKDINVQRIDPNTGPREIKNIINIYGDGTETGSNFSSGLRVFVSSSNGPEGKNLGAITDMNGKVIGLRVELPTYNAAGAVNIVLTNADKSSEYEITNGFIYLDIGNTLTIEQDGISPNYKKETEPKDVTILGRNVGYFDPASYDKLSGVDPTKYTLVGYQAISGFNNITSYKVQYTGTYNSSTPVTIIRQINVFIDGDAKIKGTPSFTKSRDTIVVNPADVNLNPNQPKQVDVTIKTSTTVFKTGTPSEVYYSRLEEYTEPDGFTYIPDEIAPTVSEITPGYGPNNEDIFMTIKGFNFQVIDDKKPEVKIGGRAAEVFGVYDDQDRLVDGRKLQLGTKVKIKLPKGLESPALQGAVDVIVKNPSQGQYTLINGFTFINPNVNRLMPKITSLKEPFADMRGGVITGETILITGENFDASLDSSHGVLVTIGGERATIKGKVSADGKTVTVIPPPGMEPGPTKLQLINEDGSMASADFEYRRAITAPKITKITPLKGGKGTKLVIKGEDFVFPDLSTNNDDPRHKGTVVLLGGKELNAYKYNGAGITSDGKDIYYNGSYDPDGAGGINAYTLNGKMVTVIDEKTIYVDIPDKFYSFDSTAADKAYLKSEDIPLGNLKVEVLNPDGTRSKENILFTYLRPATYPTITEITPASGSVNGGTIITIKGTNFKQDQLGVYFGSEEAKEIQFINSTELRVKVPIYPYGLPQGTDKLLVPVMVMNYDGGAAVKDNGFEYRIPGSQPVISSLTPERGSAAGNEEVVIRGRDFRRDPNNPDAIPKVYFNGIEASSVEWLSDDDVSELLLVTTPPSRIEGPVDVVVVNYDSGSYTYRSYNYEISRPVINSVTPNNISKQGGNKLQINGTGFKKADLTKLFEIPVGSQPSGSSSIGTDSAHPKYTEQIGRNTTNPVTASTVINSIVVFGDATTGDKKAIDTVMGLKYADLGDLRISYNNGGDADPATLGIAIAKVSNPDNPIRSLKMTVGSSHIFIINGQQDLGDAAIGDEGILVEATSNQVIVTRRIATYANWENDGMQVTAIAPAVGGIGPRKLYVQNADRGIGSYDINVLNPASNPTITYISPRNKVKRGGTIVDYVREDSADQEYYTYTPLKGGAFVTINGTDFRRNVKVYLGNKELEVLSRSLNDDQLIVKIPSGTEADLDKLYRILVVNEDGGSADSSALSKPHYIVYKKPQSGPVIESVVPDFTSSRGENTVKIIGDDFREGVKVFIDGVESPSVTLISYKELAVRIPLGLTPGKKLIQVMNPDYGFGEKKDALTIISSPSIDYVYDNTKNRLLSPVLLSIDGGQSIRLNGRDFLNGVKVIIGGTLKPKSQLQAGETGIKAYDIHDVEMVIVGGTTAANVKIINSTTLTFTTPKLKVGDYSIIVVNPDGGVSNPVAADYQKPKPDAPSGIYAEAVDSDTIKLEWDKLPDTKHYEIYASYSTSGIIVDNYIYVGSVEPYEVSEGRLRYYVDGLKASSWYSFKLKSVNSYGPSTISPATTYIKTKDTKITSYYQSVGDYVSGIAQNDKVSMAGNNLIFTAGEKSLGNYGSGLVVYLNQASYNNYDPKNVDIGINILKKYPNNSITIYEKDFTVKMLSNNLLVPETRTLPAVKLADSKITVGISKDLRTKGDEIRVKVPVGYKAITAPTAVNVTMQVEQTKTIIKNLSGNTDLVFNITNETKMKYPGGIYVAYYNNTTKKLDMLSSMIMGNTVTAKINKPGEYILLGRFIR